MKRLTKHLGKLLLLAVIFATGSIFAQPQGQQGPPSIPDDEKIQEMVSDLAKEINLSETQQEDVLELFTNHFSEVKEKMESGSRPSREEMEELKTEFEDEVKEILTEDQQADFEAYMKKQERNKPSQSQQR
jgi:Spy/CpxP family protein refolding chaperone